MSQVIEIADVGRLARGCFVCGARHWDCTVDGCKPGGGNRDGDVLHCKICNTVYVINRAGSSAVRPDGRLTVRR
jgi:hypothetical protein